MTKPQKKIVRKGRQQKQKQKQQQKNVINIRIDNSRKTKTTASKKRMQQNVPFYQPPVIPTFNIPQQQPIIINVPTREGQGIQPVNPFQQGQNLNMTSQIKEVEQQMQNENFNPNKQELPNQETLRQKREEYFSSISQKEGKLKDDSSNLFFGVSKEKMIERVEQIRRERDERIQRERDEKINEIEGLYPIYQQLFQEAKNLGVAKAQTSLDTFLRGTRNIGNSINLLRRNIENAKPKRKRGGLIIEEN